MKLSGTLFRSSFFVATTLLMPLSFALGTSPKQPLNPSFSLVEWSTKTQTALDFMIDRGIFELRSKGYDNLANALEQEYALMTPQTASLGTMAVGDHQPLSPYLDRLYLILIEKLGPEKVRTLHLEDLKIVNYAIPVVFQPCGDRRNNDTWSQQEYRLHFVPLSGAITYWATISVCSSGSWGNVTSLICAPAAELARKEMEVNLAPTLSDELYQQAQQTCQ